MKEIDRANTLRANGLRGLSLKITPMIMALVGLENGYNVTIDGNDLVLSQPASEGDHRVYRSRAGGIIAIPREWADQVEAKATTRVRKYLDTVNGQQVIRIRVA